MLISISVTHAASMSASSRAVLPTLYATAKKLNAPIAKLDKKVSVASNAYEELSAVRKKDKDWIKLDQLYTTVATLGVSRLGAGRKSDDPKAKALVAKIDRLRKRANGKPMQEALDIQQEIRALEVDLEKVLIASGSRMKPLLEQALAELKPLEAKLDKKYAKLNPLAEKRNALIAERRTHPAWKQATPALAKYHQRVREVVRGAQTSSNKALTKLARSYNALNKVPPRDYDERKANEEAKFKLAVEMEKLLLNE